MSEAAQHEAPEVIEFDLRKMGVSQSDWQKLEKNFKGWTNMVKAVELDTKTGVIRITPCFALKDRAKWEHKAESLRTNMEYSINNKVRDANRRAAGRDDQYQNTTGRSGARK